MDSFTCVQIRGVDTKKLWETDGAGALNDEARLVWAKRMAAGLFAQYQLYIRTPYSFACSLLKLVLFQNGKVCEVCALNLIPYSLWP